MTLGQAVLLVYNIVISCVCTNFISYTYKISDCDSLTDLRYMIVKQLDFSDGYVLAMLIQHSS